MKITKLGKHYRSEKHKSKDGSFNSDYIFMLPLPRNRYLTLILRSGRLSKRISE